jgi:hypothetical protein
MLYLKRKSHLISSHLISLSVGWLLGSPYPKITVITF